MANMFNFETYFNSEYDISDFIQVVEDLVVESEESTLCIEIPKEKRRKTCTPNSSPRTPKKTYAAQIMELRQEVLDLRQEIELRDTHIFALINELKKTK